MRIEASAPGSLMMLGEHAVLEGYPALACAVTARLHVILTPVPERVLRIRSGLAHYEGALDSLPPENRLRFLLEAVRRHAADLPGGAQLDVVSELSHTQGLASSAAVTVAGLGALWRYRERTIDRPALLDEAVSVIRAVQGMGSGTDAAAALHGGIVRYTANPPVAESLPGAPPITVVYSGAKTPTVEVVQRLRERRDAAPAAFAAIFAQIGSGVEEGASAVRRGDWAALGRLFNEHHAFMHDMDLSTPALEEIVAFLRHQPGILGAKISGSGLGDCVIGLGSTDRSVVSYEQVPVQISPRGLEIHA